MKRRSARTDKQGHFSLLGLAPGRYGLSGNGDGYNSPGPDPAVEIAAGQELKDVPVKLRPASPLTVAGRVLRPDGSPAENARLFLISLPGRWIRWTQVTTDAEGRFTLENLHPGEYQVAAVKVGFARGESPPFQLRPGNPLEDLTITLQEGGKVRGQVLDEAGQPVVGAVVGAASEGEDIRRFAPAEARNRRLTRLTMTDRGGRFELTHIPPGEVQVFVYAEDPLRKSRPGRDRGVIRDVCRGLSVRSGEATAPVTLRLWPLQGVIQGKVSLPDGSPLAEVRVEPGNDFLDSQRYMAHTNMQGEFRITGLPPGTYSLNAEEEGLADRSVQGIVLAPEQPQAEVALILSEGGTIRGRVVDPAGQPVAGVAVTTGTSPSRGIPANGLTLRWGRTDAEGTFILTHLAPGEYELTSTGLGYAEEKVAAVVKEGETTTVEVVMEEE